MCEVDQLIARVGCNQYGRLIKRRMAAGLPTTRCYRTRPETRPPSDAGLLL